jgi:hypothetical protein
MSGEAEPSDLNTTPSKNFPQEQDLDFSTSASDVETMFVDGVKNVVVHGGIARLSFYQVRLDSMTNALTGVHVIGLALSSDALKAFYSQLGEMINEMEQKGVL